MYDSLLFRTVIQYCLHFFGSVALQQVVDIDTQYLTAARGDILKRQLDSFCVHYTAQLDAIFLNDSLTAFVFTTARSEAIFLNDSLTAWQLDSFCVHIAQQRSFLLGIYKSCLCVTFAAYLKNPLTWNTTTSRKSKGKPSTCLAFGLRDQTAAKT